MQYGGGRDHSISLHTLFHKQRPPDGIAIRSGRNCAREVTWVRDLQLTKNTFSKMRHSHLGEANSKTRASRKEKSGTNVSCLKTTSPLYQPQKETFMSVLTMGSIRITLYVLGWDTMYSMAYGILMSHVNRTATYPATATLDPKSEKSSPPKSSRARSSSGTKFLCHGTGCQPSA